jgi:hypothetical protein
MHLRSFPVVQGDLSVTPLTGSPHGRAHRPAVALCGGARPPARRRPRAAELARTAGRGSRVAELAWMPVVAPRGGSHALRGGARPHARAIVAPARRSSPACPASDPRGGARPHGRPWPAWPLRGGGRLDAGSAPARGRSPRCRLWPLRGGGLLDAGSAPVRRLTCTAGRGPWLGRGEKMKRTVVTSPLKNTRSSYHSVVTLPNRSKLHYITQALASLAPDSSQAKVSQIAKHPPIVTWAATLCVVGPCTHPHVSQVRQPDTTSERN